MCKSKRETNQNKLILSSIQLLDISKGKIRYRIKQAFIETKGVLYDSVFEKKKHGKNKFNGCMHSFLDFASTSLSLRTQILFMIAAHKASLMLNFTVNYIQLFENVITIFKL